MFDRFKLVAEQKAGGVGGDEIIALVTSGAGQATPRSLEARRGAGGVRHHGPPTATVKMTGPDR